MASGRGWVRQQHVKQPGPAAQTLTSSLASQTPTSKVQPRCANISNAASENKGALVRTPLQRKQVVTRTSQAKYIESANISNAASENKGALVRTPLQRKPVVTRTSQAKYIESLPCEILLKILSYLDPISLMSVGQVSKRFCELSKDNVLWYKIYISSWKVNKCWKYDSEDLLLKKLRVTTISDPDLGYWKKTFVRELMMTREKNVIQIMESVKPCSSSEAAVNMRKAVKNSGLSWALTFLDVYGKETVIEQTDVYFRDSSLTLTWNSYIWPELQSLTKIQLHGITEVLTDKCYTPNKNRLQRLSLIAEYDLKKGKPFGKFIGQDMHVKLFHLDPYLILGLWKKGLEIAFVMGTIHYHQLLEKSLLGFAESPFTVPPHVPILDDVDPEYGLHGYQLHIDLHSGPRTYLCKTFRGLFCRKDYIKKGRLRMTAIGLLKNRMHAPLAGTVSFLWKTLTLSGSIQNCFMMDVTVLDESDKPYWCFSAPVQLCESQSTETLYDLMGQSFDLNYRDDVGKVQAVLIWMKETEEHYVINLVLYLNTEKVNSYFGTNYVESCRSGEESYQDSFTESWMLEEQKPETIEEFLIPIVDWAVP